MSSARQVYVTTWYKELGIVLCELENQHQVGYGISATVVSCPEKGVRTVPCVDVHATLEAAQAQVDVWIAIEASHG